MRYAAPANFSARKAGSEATSSAVMPTLAATVQQACPVRTPKAVITPALRPPSRVLRMVTAVSGPGVTMTSTATPRNASTSFMLLVHSAP